MQRRDFLLIALAPSLACGEPATKEAPASSSSTAPSARVASDAPVDPAFQGCTA